MAWPLSQDYNEAIQSPAANFTDDDLKRGAAVTNALGLPLPCSGNFADVYQVRCPDGSRWAVKCFTRQSPGLRERYAAIGKHLRDARLPFIVDFDYLQQGIRVAGRWYPVLKMQWVEGLTLHQFVAKYADRPAMLEALLHIWGRLPTYLGAARIAHGDLQHGNVLLVPGSGVNSLALKLIDYDGMWVPALARTKSGEVGHPSYQHPLRLREGTYGPEVDRFPLLLIATALRAIRVTGRPLWEKYDNGDNILFMQADLQAPTKSFLFLDLLRSSDPLTAALADHLLTALRGRLDSVPLLNGVMPESPPAATREARPAAEQARDGSRTAVMAAGARTAAAVATRRPLVKLRRTNTGRVRVAAWVAALAVVVIGFAAAWGLFRMTGGADPATAPAPAPNGAADTGPAVTGSGKPRPVVTERDRGTKHMVP
jgi:hypothetical protein